MFIFLSIVIFILVVVVECCDVLEILEFVVLDFYVYFCICIFGRMFIVIEVCYLCVDKLICGWVIFKIKNWWIGNVVYVIEFVGNN